MGRFLKELENKIAVATQSMMKDENFEDFLSNKLSVNVEKEEERGRGMLRFLKKVTLEKKTMMKDFIEMNAK